MDKMAWHRIDRCLFGPGTCHLVVCFGVLWCALVCFGVLWCALVCFGVLVCVCTFLSCCSGMLRVHFMSESEHEGKRGWIDHQLCCMAPFSASKGDKLMRSKEEGPCELEMPKLLR